MKKKLVLFLLLLLTLLTSMFASFPVKAINGWNTPTNLTSNTGVNDWHPSISADGSTIAYQSDFDGHWEIFVVNSDGTGMEQVTSVSFEAWHPSISGDGSKIAYGSYDEDEGDGEVYLINSDGTGLIQLTSNYNFLSRAARSWRSAGNCCYVPFII